MSTKYAETFLALKYRMKDSNDEMLGGAMYIWRRALFNKKKELLSSSHLSRIGAGCFCVFTILASFGIGCAVQTSAISNSFSAIMPDTPN